MLDGLKAIFSQSEFMPHIHCYLAKPSLVWTMGLTDLLIGLAYVSISLTLWALMKRIQIRFNLVILCFGVFILACGLTHFMEIWTLWYPDYWTAAAVKVITSIASVGTGIYLFQLRHSIVTVAEAAKLSEQRRLDLEILTKDLEQRVQDRTRELQASEIRFRETFEKTAVGMAHVGLDGRWLRVNAHLCQITGYSEAELLTKGFGDITYPDDLEQDWVLIQKLLDHKIPEYLLEKRYLHKDGRIIWVKISVALNWTRDGEENYFIVSIDDITERKSLQVERERLYELPNHLLCVLDEQSQFKSINAGFTNVLGYSLEDLQGKSIWSFIHPEDLQASISTEQKGQMTVIDGFENRFLTKRGDYRWLRWTGTVINGTNYGAAIDITELKRVEQSLRDREQQFRALAESIPQLAWIANAQGSIFWFNQRWYQYTGTAEREVVGRGWQTVHDPQELPQVIEKWENSIKTGQPLEMEFYLRGGDGKFRWFLTRMMPLRDSAGQITQWFGTSTDIDEQNRLRMSLESAVQARDEFLSIASHELKTPLTSLKLESQLRMKTISKKGATAFPLDKLSALFESDQKQIHRINHLIEDMLDISQINTGKLTVRREWFDLTKAAKDVIERHQQMAEQARCTLFLERAPAVFGHWDRYRIEQVISNLIVNAIKYGPGKPIEVSVAVEKWGDKGKAEEGAEQEGKVRLSVKDYGMGISKENQGRIFMRFERAISANEISGLGLGLYISKQIAEMHGGKILVESDVGKGAKFTLELPFASGRLGEK